MKQYLAIDIGGTSVKLGIVDEGGCVLAKAEQSVCFDYYETPILTTVLSASEQFLKEQDVRPQSLAGIGVSATGQIDTHTGTVVGTCGSLPNYIGSPIKAELEAKFGLPVTVANDANCMTLGEVWVGGAKGYTDVIGVTLGTGVGGGILTGGRLLEGARGLGGELGHYRTHALDGVLCTCGASGCWERYAATTALVRAAQPRNHKWRDGVPSSNRPMRATPSSSPFSRTGRTRSCRALRGWCTSSTRRSSSSAAASALSRSCSSNPSPER